MPEKNALHPTNSLPIRAVILDYGEVLCQRPAPEVVNRMAGIFRLDRESFPEIYARSRNPYDQGVISTEDYWKEFAKNSGVELDKELAAKLPLWDIQMWSRINPVMIDWLEALHNSGLPTAILSNMTHSMKAFMLENFAWLSYFNCHVFSCDIQVIKPHPAIYRHCLDCLGAAAEETLFIDDRQANIEGAQAIGIQAIRFHSAEQLRTDLERLGFPILPQHSESMLLSL
jgi:putative hydrolase of the HAD superfamily